MILGDYPAGIYFQVASITTIFTLFVIYWISQYYGHDKPFPYSWISSIADHFPQYVFFRTATISGSTLICLGWFTNHFYLQTIGVQNVINIHKYKPTIMLVTGMMGAMFLMGSTANIDTGKHNSKWHTFCAQKFFLLTLISQVYNACVFAHLYFKHKVVNKYLVYLKLTQIFLILIQLYISNKGNYFQKYGLAFEENDVDSVMGVILEWTLTCTVLFGFLIMSFDVAHFRFVYENFPTKGIQTNIQQQQHELNSVNSINQYPVQSIQ